MMRWDETEDVNELLHRPVNRRQCKEAEELEWPDREVIGIADEQSPTRDEGWVHSAASLLVNI